MAIMYRGIVKKLDVDKADILIPRLSGIHPYRNLNIFAGNDLQVGDNVIVGTVGEVLEDLVVLGRLTPVYTGPEEIPVYYFDDEVARDTVFPSPPDIVVFAWIDDVQELQVYSPGVDAWVVVSWDEARIVAIENQVNAIELDVTTLFTNYTTLSGTVTTLGTNLTTLAGNAVTGVTDSSTIDLTKTGNNLTASVIPNVISLDQLANVAISSPATGETIRYDGANYVNARLDLDDIDPVFLSGVAKGDVFEYDGSDWSNTKPFDRVVGGAYYTGGTGVTATNTEVALAAWTASDTHDFEQGQLYRLKLCCGYADSNGVSHLLSVRLRKGENTIVGQELAVFRQATSANLGNQVHQMERSGYVKNATGALVSTKVGVTAQRVAAGGTAANVLLYGDASIRFYLEVVHVGRAADHPTLAAIAVEIA